ncbi:hypothetical protein LEP1GSC059_1659 [Leptospira noguchii serovar Panama str. CZ214]|uniref:Uncharacterized protein n=1 Tax=Leptospira noguchii serovar Panama str. CZ214 TaxID=1001595 RepID=T0H133_9LEPT|nr:hypothetical protein LEP1GSC059_1659 [Leptospira noguchii serovar Panama str. CZ214]
MIKKNFSHSSESRTLKPEEKDFLLAIISEDDPESIGSRSIGFDSCSRTFGWSHGFNPIHSKRM